MKSVLYAEKYTMTAEEALIKLFWRKHYNVQFPTKLIKSDLFNNIRFSASAKYDDIELYATYNSKRKSYSIPWASQIYFL